MSKLMDKLKRMEPFQAQKKQNILKKQIKDPQIENSTYQDIDEKFNSLCNFQSQQLINFELKIPPPQLDEEQLKAYSRNKIQRSSTKRQSTIVQASKLQSTRSSQIIQGGKLNIQSPKMSVTNSVFASQVLTSPQIDSDHFLQLKGHQKQQNKQNINSQTQLSQLKTSASLNSAKRLSPLKVSTMNLNKDKSQQDDIHSPEKRLHQMRKNQGNIRFTKKKSTYVFNEHATQNKQNDKESDIDERVSQSPEWLLIQQKLKNAIKNKKHQQEDDYINPVVQLFGNNFIAMVLQALIIKKIDDLYGMKINTDSNIPISENLLKQFGISSTMLNSLNSANEKRQYIADTMTARISLMIKEWDEKQGFRQQKLQQDEKITDKEEQRKNESQGDMFDWLKIETNHDQLKKKLRMAIVEKLTDFENQEELKKLRQQKEQQQNQNQYTGSKKLEINLKNVPYVSTKVLLLRMDEQDNKYLIEGMTKEQLDQYQEIAHVDYMEENKKNSQKQRNEREQQENSEIQNTDAENDELPEWSDELEKEFLNNKKLAKIIYSEDISVSNWNQQGYLPLVQEYNLSNKKKMEREQLITNYQNGIWLTEKELKFIADTSSLLNKCIDQNYVQKIVNHISKDDVSRLELSLAENIITNYQNMQNLIREQRLKFLKQRQAKLLEKREQNRQKQLMKEQREKELKIQRRYVKMFKTIGDRLLSNKVQYTFDVLQKNFFCRIFFENMKSVLNKYRKRKEILAFQTEEGIKKMKLQDQLANQKDFVKRLAKAENIKKVCGKQHELHPPSKIAYFAPSDDPIDSKREELMNFMSDRFKLSTRSKQEVRIKENFSKYYSGGPQKSELEEQPNVNGKDYLQKIQLTKKQFAGIIRVQRLFRQFRMRKIIQNMKEQEYSIKLSQYKEKLRSYLSGRKFLKITQTKLGREIIPQKGVIENIRVDESQAFSEQIYSSDDENGNYKDKAKQDYKTTKSPNKQQKGSLNLALQTPKSNQQNENIKDFYNLHSTYGDTLSTDRHRLQSKTVEDENNSKNQISHIKFLTNEKNLTLSNLDETDHYSNESPKTKTSKQNLEYQNQPSIKQENKVLEEGIRLSVTRCSNTDVGTATHKKNNPSLVSFLSHKQVSYNPTLLLKQQKLLQAAQSNQFLQIRNSGYLINQSDVNCKDKKQNTALIYAIQHQNITFIRWLLSKGADVNILCAQGNTPVHQAFKTNNHEILHDILCMKPDLNKINQEGLTPLAYASQDTIKKFDLKDCIVFKNDPINIQEDVNITTQNNNQMFIREKKPLKALGKLKLNNFFPIKSPTIQQVNYTSM
ncbi:IQ calmodulin-binding motif protein (macronuclear) [Tetrahymena thermophila SB210]|uniref:IQ calmodulin-binding motif protein n=1 Tax=Tetrahymena thermophila (strain SB210) TaxID=312017 RepID=I7LXT0_TETTS|nr:IQ calmodulin-binding motif protein [Tetrahymena thermophila SB210]EAS06131.2 IQ calmodulin-binding motif protein [Tetrahymena thermophila SB210]|eukprot:XP_001026376.2 IQ calmodulin-binding motif protein [Tetrahymena thermophila SB210]